MVFNAGAMFFWIVAYVGSFLLLLAIFPSAGGYVFVMACFLAVPAPAIWIRVMDRRLYRAADRSDPIRARRLAWLVQADRSNRYPHRHIERMLRVGPLKVRRLVPLLQRMPPRPLVYVCSLNDRRMIGPAANAIHFEPIDIAHDAQGLTAVFTMNLEQQGLIAPPHPSEAHERHTPKAREHLRSISGFLRRRWGMVLWCLLLLLLYPRNWIYVVAFPVACFIVGLIIAWLMLLFREQTWWLVPGGLICREFRFWRRGVEIKRFTPADTPMFINARKGWGFVLDQGRPIKFPCPQTTSWVIAAGWISTARTPSLNEVRAFLGQR